MAIDYLNKNGLSYFWSKLKAYFAPKAHTHNAFETKHSYTTAANAAKNWYRIANASTQQLDTSKPIRAQFIVTAYNTSYAADYYETWFVNAIVFGRQAHIVIFGGSGVPFSQARILYENTVANIDANDRPAIDLYLNYVLPNGTTKIEVEEVYNNGGWTFLADGQLAASTVPSGFESIASAPRNNGVNNASNADYATYLNRQISNITAAFTLADSYLYRSRTLNCTGTFTITIPSINSGYMWCVIKNKNTSSGVITLHPSTTSVLIDGSNADIKLQPMEYVCIHSAGANNYSLIADGRWKSQKANDNAVVHLAGAETITGAKTFSSNVAITKGNPILTHKNTSTETTVYPSSGQQDARINFQDKNGHQLGSILHRIQPTNSAMYLRVFNFNRTDSDNAWSDIAIGYDNNGNIYTSAPTPSTSDNSTKIATTAFVKSQGYLTSHQTLPTLSKTDSGSGNAVTAISVNDHAITVTKGSTFALDSDVIHKDSNEAIEGIKEFSNSYQDSTIEGETDWESSSLIIRYKNYIKGSGVPSANKYANLIFLDKTGTNINWNGRMGCVENDVIPNGTHRTRLICYKNEIINGVDTREYAAINVGYDSNGIMYASAPETDTVRNSDYDILTRNWIPKDTRIVHTTGDETINGEKTFTTSVKIKRGNPYINFVETDITKFTDGDNVPYQGLYFRDKNEDMYASLIGQTYSDRSNIDIFVYDRSDNYSLFRFYRKPDGTETFASFPTPAASAASTQVATAAWVRTFCDTTQKYMKAVSVTGSGNAVTAASLSNGTLTLTKGTTFLTSHQSLANYVTLNGTQSITGAKTFTQSIEINRSNPYIVLVETDIKKGTGVDSGGTSYQGIYFEDKNGNIMGAVMGAIYGGGSNKQYWVTLHANDVRTASSSGDAVVGLEFGSSGVKSFRPEPTNDVQLGLSNRRWKEIWCNQSSINTSSDERIKDSISDVPDAVLDAWAGVRWRQFRYRDAVAEKGIAARLHSGAVAQEIGRAFSEAGLDASRYGFFLHDAWSATEETRNDEGVVLSYASPAGDEYGLRYVEALCMEAAYMRRENARLKKRVSDLEERLAALELRPGSE